MIELNLPSGGLSVLCLGAHPDDIEIGCGGALLTLAERQTVDVAALLLTGAADRIAESQAAMRAFSGDSGLQIESAGLPDGRLPSYWADAKDFLEQAATGRAVDIVFAPRTDDSHQDHAVLAALAATVWRDSLILRYEIPKWDGDLAAATTYIALTDEVAARKVELLHEYFPSQHARDWWDSETFFAIMRLRGVECRARYAEAFVSSKLVLGPSVG